MPRTLTLSSIFNLKKYCFTDEGEWADEWVEFPHLPQHESIVKDFDEITSIITEEVTKRAGKSSGIIKEEIILRIISPHVINLTLLDLPGITYVSREVNIKF